MALSRRSKTTVLALLVLVVPSICYMLLRTGTNYYHSLPVYGPHGETALSDSIPDSAWYRVDLSGFIAESGGRQASGGKIYVAGFVRANANAAADTLAVNMIRLGKTYKDMKRLQFITFIGTDSASTGRDSTSISADSPAAATNFEKLLQRYGADPGKWTAVRLPVNEAAEVARRMFFLHAVPAANDPGQPLSDTVVLLDSRRRIRGYYDGSSYFATDTLEDEIAVLWKEEMNRDDQK